MNWTSIRFKVLSNKRLGKLLIALDYKRLSSYKSNRWGGDSFNEEIERQFSVFLKGDNQLRDSLKVDIIWCYYRFGSTPIEFFLYDFKNKSIKERSTYLTTKRKDDICRGITPFSVFVNELENKYNFYSLMKPFYKREAFLLDSETNKDWFECFFREKGRLFFKPLCGQCGQGVHISFYNQLEFDTFFSSHISANQKWMVEETINQDESLSVFNSSSVNTIRINTFNTAKGFVVFTCFLRVGRKGSVCDNGGAGGLLIQVDDKTGRIVSDAYDEKGNKYASHPDSGVRFKGYQIPRWEDLIQTAVSAHQVLSHHKFIGWDFAYSDKGWVLVEGNWGAFISQQLTRGCGLLNEFVKLMSS